MPKRPTIIRPGDHVEDEPEDQTAVELPAMPTPPRQTITDLIVELATLHGHLRKELRLTENGANNIMRMGLEYDINRRQISLQQPPMALSTTEEPDGEDPILTN